MLIQHSMPLLSGASKRTRSLQLTSWHCRHGCRSERDLAWSPLIGRLTLVSNFSSRQVPLLRLSSQGHAHHIEMLTHPHPSDLLLPRDVPPARIPSESVAKLEYTAPTTWSEWSHTQGDPHHSRQQRQLQRPNSAGACNSVSCGASRSTRRPQSASDPRQRRRDVLVARAAARRERTAAGQVSSTSVQVARAIPCPYTPPLLQPLTVLWLTVVSLA